MSAPVTPSTEPPPSIMDPLMAIWNNIAGSILGMMTWVATVAFIVCALSFALTLGVTTAQKVARRGQPKAMSAAEQKQRRDSRTDKLQALTLKNLSEADGYEYRRLLAQEKNGIVAATERLDQLETMAHMTLAAKEVA